MLNFYEKNLNDACCLGMITNPIEYLRKNFYKLPANNRILIEEDNFCYQEENQCCYVLEMKNSRFETIGVKVGFTTNLSNRLRDLIKDSYRLGYSSLVVYKIFNFENIHDAYAFECILHRYYSQKEKSEQFKSDYFLNAVYEKEDSEKLDKIKENFLKIFA